MKVTKQQLFLHLTAIRNYIDIGDFELALINVEEFNKKWDEFIETAIPIDETKEKIIIEQDEI